MARANERSKEAADRLHSASIHLLRRVRKEDESSGLTPARLSALSVVVFAGPLTLGKLAEAEGVRPPTMTRIVQALEEAGLVLKDWSATDDRRTVSITATQRGTRLLQAARERRTQSLAQQLERLAPDEVE
ncbi:MAG: MarR family transcriptional regulator, partial [Actinobacteria bacterium]|nr:MarR family transcriptional regulator [Actinomycetota bacterium]